MSHKKFAKKRILFLISDTGGGHRSSAEAIEEAIHYLYPNSYHTIIEDIWQNYTPWPINKLPKSYGWVVGPGLLLWKLMWFSSKYLQSHQLVLWGLYPFIRAKIGSYLKQINPDIVVSVHPLMNHLGVRLLNSINLSIPFITVVTDMVTVHPAWICPQVSLCLVSTEIAKEVAIKLGIIAEKVKVCGQPVKLKFKLSKESKMAVRQRLGLDLKRLTIMLMGGGEGSGRVLEIAKEIANTVSQAQLIIVAGRNLGLKKCLEEIKWQIPVYIYGFVDIISDFMQASDILVSKAGPGTISEAFIAKLPIIISGYIYGQEWGNVSYIQSHQAGIYCESPAGIAQIIKKWGISNNNDLDNLRHNAACLAQPNSSLNIAKEIHNLLRHKHFDFQP